MSQDLADIRLPKAWPKRVRSAIVHVIALGRTAILYARGKAANTPLAAARLRAKLDSACAEISMLREELRIKDARLATLDPRRRPHYRPTERMSIVELRAARGWSVAETARVFLVKPATIASWWKRVDEEGESPLVQTQTPVNKFPDFVRYIVCRLKVLHPTLGKKRIAQLLARAGLHIGVTTVKRMLDQGSTEPPAGNGDQVLDPTQKRPNKPVKSTYPDHVWQIDFTLVPTSAGFWVPWLPHAVPQCWPFCWWVACVVDHFSRRVVGFTVFERFFRSLKVEMLCCEHVPFRRDDLRAVLVSYTVWFNEYRPHQGLCGRTPNEVFFGQNPANEKKRIEPRARWPRSSPCALPPAGQRGRSGRVVDLVVHYHNNDKRLPIVKLRKVA